jgi:hypothetical protein
MLEIWMLNEQDIFLPVLSQDREKAEESATIPTS